MTIDPNGSFIVPNRLWRLKGTEVWMLLTLYYCTQNGIKTSLRSLSRTSHSSLSTVQRDINKLVKRELITKQTRKDEEGANLPTTYIINDDAIRAACEV